MRSPLKAVFWAILAFISLALVAASIDVVRSLKAREELQIRRGQAVVQPNHSSRALIDGLRPLPHLVYAAQAANASRSASKRAIAFPLVDDTVMLA